MSKKNRHEPQSPPAAIDETPTARAPVPELWGVGIAPASEGGFLAYRISTLGAIEPLGPRKADGITPRPCSKPLALSRAFDEFKNFANSVRR